MSEFTLHEQVNLQSFCERRVLIAEKQLRRYKAFIGKIDTTDYAQVAKLTVKLISSENKVLACREVLLENMDIPRLAN